MVADRLAQLHFSAQDQRPAELAGVEIVELDPFLRGLLFTDGTVSRALEAYTLAPVTVEPLDQAQTTAPALLARQLQIDPDERCIRRRIVMRIGGEASSVWAETYVAPQRLPPEFLASLASSAAGIGGSLQQLRLESWRELLWFGLGQAPDWSVGAAAGQQTLTRMYRIITGGRPALLISEAFAVAVRDGLYHLVGSADALAGGAHEDAQRSANGGGPRSPAA